MTVSAEDKFQAKYSEGYLADFKTLSFDDKNKKSLCQNTTHKYYNFDKIVKDRNYDMTPASPDALIFKNDKIYCVEFKNSIKRRVPAQGIKKKLEYGHQVLLEIFKELNLQIKEYKLIFCVVYKGFDETEKEKKKWKKIHDKISHKRIAKFDLEQYKPELYNDIFTNDVDFFRKQFIQKIDKELPC